MVQAARDCPMQACHPDVEKSAVFAQLFLGRDIPGRGPVTDDEWSGFVEGVITQHFPQGFTVFDADGQWQDQRTGSIGKERTKILIVSADDEPALYEKLSHVAQEYQRRFQQKSIRLITTATCVQVLKF